MNNRHINIAVLEPSQIIYEGLSNIFLKSGQYFQLLRVDTFDELENYIGKKKLDVIIINPSQIQNKDKEFIALKNAQTDTYWVALVYTFFNQKMLSLFDKTIHITDTPDSIIGLINKINESNSSASPTAGHEQLSDREIEVLKLVAAGLSNKEIADKLFISIHTVISHRKNISQKTGIKSQSGLTIYAILNKIIQIEDFSS
ncbi:MAG: LuxR C-terminal-related transcriptional regulator [Melioribacteraceae bacterium]